MKFFKVHSTAKCGIHKSIQFILEIVFFLERKIEVVVLQKIFLGFNKHTP